MMFVLPGKRIQSDIPGRDPFAPGGLRSNACCISPEMEADMSETSLMIQLPDVKLEALYAKGNGKAAALLCHPHPLYGGSMDNNVVWALQETYEKSGFGTLRFNFRGVGRSEGVYGRGQSEARDVLGMASYLREQGFEVLHGAAYSFGVWVLLIAVGLGLKVESLVLASPPVDFLPFDELQLPAEPSLVTLGSSDQFCAVDSLQSWLDGASAPELVHVEILPVCDHFYWEREETLSEFVASFLNDHVARSVT